MCMLRRWKAKHEIVESPKQLECSGCRELQRPRLTHQDIEKKATHFGHSMAFGEFEVTLTNIGRGRRYSSHARRGVFLRRCGPMQAKQPSFAELSKVLTKAWFSCAGIPAILRFHPAGAHASEPMRDFCAQVDKTPLVGPAEAYDRTARAASSGASTSSRATSAASRTS